MKTHLLFIFVALISAAIIASPAVSAAESFPDVQISTELTSEEQDDIWRVRNRCGVNATYLFARLLHKNVEYEDVLETVPIDSSGTSMMSMKNYLNQIGVSAAVIRSTTEQLTDISLPAIAMLEEDVNAGGHFVVLCAVSDRDVRLIDGTRGAVDIVEYDEFIEQWNGFLIVDQGQNSFPLTWLWYFTVFLGVVTILHSFRQQPKEHLDSNSISTE